LDPERFLRVDGAVGQLVAGFHPLPFHDADARAVGDRVDLRLRLAFHFDFPAVLLVADVLDDPVDLGNDRLAFRIPGFKQLLDPRQTLRDVLAGHAAGVERAHGELRAGFADGLGGDDADRFPDFHHLAGGQVAAVAHPADAVPRSAAEHRADGYLLDARLHDGVGLLGVDQLVAADDALARLRMADRLEGETAFDPVVQILDDLVAVLDSRDHEPLVGAAVFLADDDVLRHVDQTAGEVTRVGGP